MFKFLQAGNHFTGKGVKKFLTFLDDFDILDRCKGFKIQITKDKTLVSSIKSWFARILVNMSEKAIFIIFRIFRRYVLDLYTVSCEADSNYQSNLLDLLFAEQKDIKQLNLKHE